MFWYKRGYQYERETLLRNWRDLPPVAWKEHWPSWREAWADVVAHPEISEATRVWLAAFRLAVPPQILRATLNRVAGEALEAYVFDQGHQDDRATLEKAHQIALTYQGETDEIRQERLEVKTINWWGVSKALCVLIAGELERDVNLPAQIRFALGCGLVTPERICEIFSSEIG